MKSERDHRSRLPGLEPPGLGDEHCGNFLLAQDRLGGGIMSLASLVICLLTLWFYDWSKRDWLGIEAVKSLREPGEARGFIKRLLARVLQKGGVPAFLALSIYTDPFITTAYMRRGAFNGMTSRDWGIFFGSWVIGNGEWILVLSGGIWVVRALLERAGW